MFLILYYIWLKMNSLSLNQHGLADPYNCADGFESLQEGMVLQNIIKKRQVHGSTHLPSSCPLKNLARDMSIIRLCLCVCLQVCVCVRVQFLFIGGCFCARVCLGSPLQPGLPDLKEYLGSGNPDLQVRKSSRGLATQTSRLEY